jgi:hypothetical protein
MWTLWFFRDDLIRCRAGILAEKVRRVQQHQPDQQQSLRENGHGNRLS